jgi:hypothetical protein
MPLVKDAPLILSGQIIALDLTSDYETKAPTGAKVTILAGDGMTVVKLKLDALQAQKPIAGDAVVWYVRPVPYAMEGNSGMSVGFVRNVDMGDLDALHSKLAALVK